MVGTEKYGGDTARLSLPIQTDDQSLHIKATTRTKLGDGRLSLLVDLGSRINVIGSNTAQEFTNVCTAAGYDPKYSRRSRRLNVNGVGAGSAPCDEELDVPIAVAYNSKTVTMPMWPLEVEQIYLPLWDVILSRKKMP